MQDQQMEQLPKSGATKEKPPTIRGIWAEMDEPDEEWKALNEEKRTYPWGEYAGMPKFKSKEEAAEFMKDHAYAAGRDKKDWEWKRGSNPEPGFEHMNHVFTMLVEWTQIEKYLIPKIEEYDWRFPSRPSQPELPKENRYAFGQPEGNAVVEGIQKRLNLSFHKSMGRESTINTLRYLFFHMRCGIFVSIRQQQVVLFAPFANKNYKNDWGDELRIEHVNGTHMNKKDVFSSYYGEKEKNGVRPENVLGKATGDTSGWYANGNIICNEHVRPGIPDDQSNYFGDQFLVELKDMLQQACRERRIDDAEFFINKRDYPQLKANPQALNIHPHPAEPYGFIYDKDDKDRTQDLPLKRHRYSSYAPILSFYISERFADLPVPCSEDWGAATGLVFPHGSLRDGFTKQNLEKHERKWEDKINVAFFRGNATGGGVTVGTNQRLALAQRGAEWAIDKKYNGEEEIQSLPHPQDPKMKYLKNIRTKKKGWAMSDVLEPYLDAQVTGTNPRDKKIAGKPMTFIRYQRGQRPAQVGEEGFAFEIDRQKHWVDMYKQSMYKYILYVEGHCAANRYAFLMRLGSVIFKMESKCVADSMWFFPVLTPLAADGSNFKEADHVPIAKDLSDLGAKIEWCRANDDACREIVKNAHKKYEDWCSRGAILDYVQLLCHEISNRWGTAPPEGPNSSSTAAADALALQNPKNAKEGVKEEGAEAAVDRAEVQDHEGSLASAKAVGSVTGDFELRDWWTPPNQRPPPPNVPNFHCAKRCVRLEDGEFEWCQRCLEGQQREEAAARGGAAGGGGSAGGGATSVKQTKESLKARMAAKMAAKKRKAAEDGGSPNKSSSAKRPRVGLSQQAMMQRVKEQGELVGDSLKIKFKPPPQ
jgi:hypothetical protein